MSIRTDLVLEQKEMHTEDLSGAESDISKIGVAEIEKVIIKTHAAAKALSKPIGTYITISFPELLSLADYDDISRAIIYSLKELLGKTENNFLAIGLGNADITPDAIGPFTVDKLLATRHISSSLANTLGLHGLKNVSALIPGVLGKTGIEALEIIKGTVERTSPEAVIVIDALAARRTERLCRTVQLCNTGISPGSGVQNSRAQISEDILGVPVVAIGIPTVADIGSIISDLGGKTPQGAHNSMMVTPKDIDLLVRRSSEVLADALNKFLQPSLDAETIKALV